MPSITFRFFGTVTSGFTLLRRISSVSALLLICVTLTLGAIWAFPMWDDGWFLLLLREHSASEIVPSLGDRPTWARLLAFFATFESSFWYVAFAAQALLWPALGLLSALLWNFLFPDLRQFAFTVACLAVAPIVTTVQMMTGAQFALGPLLSVVLAYGALLLLLQFITTKQRLDDFYLVVGLILCATSIILTEYGVPVVLVAIILVLTYPWLANDYNYGVRVYVVILLVIVVTIVIYVVYVSLADSGIRPMNHPANIVTQDFSKLLRIPSRLVESAWKGVAGGLMTALAQVRVRRLDLLPIAYGMLVAGLLVFGSYRSHQAAVSTQHIQKRLFILTVALLLGLLPPILIGRIPFDDGFNSRFGVPVLPIVAMLTVFLGVQLIQPRFWFVPILLFGFAAGYVTCSQVQSALHERRIMVHAGAELLPYASSSRGISVAVVALPERYLGAHHAWELTARLTYEWPPELGERFWAYNLKKARSIFGERANCNKTQEIDEEIRMVVRKGSLSQLLWIAPGPDSSVTIEPYCVQ